MTPEHLEHGRSTFETICSDPRVKSFVDRCWFAASAPGRADFLNTHQDYKGLPVVPVAISLRTYVLGRPRDDRTITVRALDLEDQHLTSRDFFSIDKIRYKGSKWFGDYFRAVASVVGQSVGHAKLRGMDLLVSSQIPIGSGLASSAAIEVAFLTLLNHHLDLGFDPLRIAELAFQAEREELGIPCGPLDQYGSSLGGIIKIDSRHPITVERLPTLPLIFAIIDSGIRHSTGEIHPTRQREIDDALKQILSRPELPQELRKKLGSKHNNSLWELIDEREIAPHLDILDKKLADRILFTLRMQRSTVAALTMIRSASGAFDELKTILPDVGVQLVQKRSSRAAKLWVLGEIMNYQHELLRDLYDVSLPALERIRQTALEAGALGVKISGAGMGGALIALAKCIDEARKIVDASIRAGASQGWVSGLEEGARLERFKPE